VAEGAATADLCRSHGELVAVAAPWAGAAAGARPCRCAM